MDRRRLHARLDAAVQHPLTAVVAPAGSGKSVLVSAWAATRSDVARVDLEVRHRSPELFWTAALAALRGATGVRADHPLAQRQPGDVVDEAWLDGVAEALDALSSPVVLVLDDVHLLEDPADVPVPAGSGDLWSGLDRVLAATAALHVVAVGRTPPRLPLHRLRAAGRLAEVTAADLAFTRAETSVLLRTEGVDIGEAAVDELLDRTRGWAVAVRLTAQQLRDRPGGTGALRDLGRAGPVADYLIGELLDGLGPELTEFLVRTSVVDHLDAETAALLTADADTGAPDDAATSAASATLLQLATSALVEQYFPAATAESGPARRSPSPCFAYHPLLRDLLRARLTERRALRGELHRRAALHWERAGEWLGALAHALDAGDQELAVDIVMRSAAAHFASHERVALLRQLERMPPDRAVGDPARMTLQAAAAYCRYDVPGMVRLAAEADALLAGPAGAAMDDLRRRTTTVVLRVLQAGVANLVGGPGQMLTMARAAGDQVRRLAVEAVPAWAEYDDVTACLTGTAEVWAGDLATGVARLRTRHAMARTAPLLGVHAAGTRGIGLVLLGRTAEADALAREVLARARGHGWDHSSLCAPAWTASALAAVEGGEPDRAAAAVETARVVAAAGAPDQLTRTGIEVADTLRLLLAAGPAAAAAALPEAQAVVGARADVGVLGPWVAITAAQVHLADEDVDTATAVLRAAGAGTSTGRGRPLARRLDAWLARCLALASRPAEALGLLPVHPLHVENGDDLTALEGALSAVVAGLTAGHRNGVKAPAAAADPHATLAAALVFAARRGLVLPLLSARAETPAFVPALEECLAGGLPEGAAALAVRVLGDTRPEPAAPSRPAEGPDGPRVGLTDRELAVLELLPTLLTAHEIAARLYVTTHTVRHHLKSIYRKLDVGSRRDAVDRAARLGVVDLPSPSARAGRGRR